MRRLAWVIAATVLLWSGPASAQTVTARPGVDPYSDPPVVEASGFPTDAPITVTLERGSTTGGKLFRSSAVFRTDALGRFRLGEAAPASGDWTVADAAAGFWALKIADGSGPPTGEARITVSAENGASASASVSVRSSDPAVTILDVPGFPGARLALPPGQGPFPVVIMLGGSEGGDSTARAMPQRLASYGIAALGLPYYAPPYGGQTLEGLPPAFSKIPVDRLEQVRAWIATDPRLDAERIGLWGASKGAEFSLIAASRYDWLDAVAAIVPSDVVWEGWGQPNPGPSFSFRGEPLPFVPYLNVEAVYAPQPPGAPRRTIREAQEEGRWRDPERAVAARIPAERYRGPLLLAGGEKDPVWNSSAMAANIAERRAEAGLPTVLLNFSDAGHGLTPPPLSPADDSFGGTGVGNGRARTAVWKATVQLFREAFGL